MLFVTNNKLLISNFINMLNCVTFWQNAKESRANVNNRFSCPCVVQTSYGCWKQGKGCLMEIKVNNGLNP